MALPLLKPDAVKPPLRLLLLPLPTVVAVLAMQLLPNGVREIRWVLVGGVAANDIMERRPPPPLLLLLALDPPALP